MDFKLNQNATRRIYCKEKRTETNLCDVMEKMYSILFHFTLFNGQITNKIV